MDVEVPEGSGPLRARMDGYIDPLTRRGAFRIEDRTGRVLRRIREARNSQEALALYWRCAGAALPGAMMSKDLDRRISRARAGGAGHQAMQTPELPFEAAFPADETDGEGAHEGEPDEAAQEPGVSAFQARRLRPRRPAPLVPQTDLFATDDADTTAAGVTPEHEPEPDPEPVPVPEPDALAVEPAIAPKRPPALPKDPEPRVLTAEAVMLQRVDPRQLRPTDRTDSYLYHITNGPDAEVTLRQGLVVSANDPMILTERQGVSYWLSVLAEDYDYIMDGPADFVVLRLRRLAVEELLEPDPHATRSAGCPCYLLTGRRRTA